MNERLDELFDAALSIPERQRAAWLDSVCGDDAELRRALARLLAADARPDGVLESRRPLLMDVMSADRRHPERFGVWKVRGPIGSGGMGEVWLAERDDAGFMQRAAVKQVAWPTPGLLQRFQRERQILAQLEHPGIARLIDGGMDDAGCPWLAMEFVEGVRIDRWAGKQAHDVRAIVRLLLQVCETVQFAHRNLVVHSDIKPSNILVGANGEPRLLDFGVAQVLAEQDEEGTRTATRLATPEYAAPEWLAGGGVTTAVDIYALGVLAYELLCGSKPYRLDFGSDLVRQLAGMSAQPPSAVVPPGDSTARARRRALRGDLDRVVMTAMARDPERRYATVQALAEDLRNWLGGRAVNARGDHRTYRLRKFVARNRVATATVALAATALLAATFVSLHAARVARAQAARADAVRQFLASTFAQVDPNHNQGQPVTLHQLLEESEQRLNADAGMPSSVRADLKALIGGFYWNVADDVAAERVLGQALALDPQGALPAAARARALVVLARVENDRGANGAANRHIEEALELAGRTGDQRSATADEARHLHARFTVQTDAGLAERLLRDQIEHDRATHGMSTRTAVEDLIALGSALGILARYDEADAALSQAAAHARQIGGPYRSSLGLALDLLGVVRVQSGRYAGANEAFAGSLQVVSHLWGEHNVRSSIVRSQLLDLAVHEGRASEVLAALRRATAEAKVVREQRPDHYAEAWESLADAYLALGRLNEAQSAYLQAISLWSLVPEAGKSSATVDAISGLGTALMLEGRYAEAVQRYRAAIGIEDQRDPDDVRALNRDRAELGNVLRLQHDYAKALRLVAQAAQSGADDASANPARIKILARLAEAELEVGQIDQAGNSAAQALAMARDVLPAGNWQLGAPLFALARIELQRGRAARSETLLREALGVRMPLHAGDDPRVLEVQVALVRALSMQGKTAEAAALRADLEPALAASSSPYLADLHQRLPAG